MTKHTSVSETPSAAVNGPTTEPDSEVQMLRRKLTERKELLLCAEMALADAQRKFAEFYEFAPIGFLTLTSAGLILEANETAAAMLRQRKSDLLGADFAEIVKPQCKDDFLLFCQHVLSGVNVAAKSTSATSGNTKYTCEVVLNSPNLPDVQLRLEALAKLEQTRDLHQFHVTLIDISEQKRIERELRTSETFHRQIAELTSDYAYTCKVLPDGIVEFETATDGFQRTLGYTLEEVQQRGGWPSIIHPEDLALAANILPQVKTGGENTWKLRVVDKNGQSHWIRFSCGPVFDHDGKTLTGIIGAVTDISEAKRSEKKLRDSANRLQSLSRRLLEIQELERRRLAREMHDEIGQSLTAILLKLALTDNLQGQAHRDGILQTKEMISELMTRVREIGLELRPSMLDDLGLVPALRSQVERFSASTDIKIHFEYTDRMPRRFQPPEVETAAFRIVQEALTNVARHAKTRTAYVRLWEQFGFLFVQIEDHGVGFDAGDIFASVASIGLSGMQERATSLGGEFAIRSRPGAGTCLTAKIPTAISKDSMS